MAARQSLRIFVGNTPWTVSSRELRGYFAEFGPVKNARVLFNPDTGLSKGVGFVTMGNVEAYNQVFRHPTHILEGHTLIVNPANVNSAAAGDQ